MDHTIYEIVKIINFDISFGSLKESGLIRHYHTIAQGAFFIGSLLMICAFVWGGYVLLKQYGVLKSKAGEPASPNSTKI